MDQATAQSFVGASLAASVYTNRLIRKSAELDIRVEREQSALQVSEMMLERTKQLKESLALQSVESARGVGGVTGFRQVASATQANFTSDMQALKTQGSFVQLTAQRKKAQARLNQFASNLNAASSAMSQAASMGLFQG